MKVGVTGCAGRMGQMLVQELQSNSSATLIGGTERPNSPHLGKDLGLVCGLDDLKLIVTDKPDHLFRLADVVIDFTTPEATLFNAKLAEEHKTALVIGTTGFTHSDLETIKNYASDVAIVHASNFSIGVNLLLGLAQKSSSVLGYDYDVEICEMHHKHKVDSPSGTALSIGEAVARGAGTELSEAAIKVRDGIIGPRRPGSIGFATLRGGSVVGEHTVIYAGEGERIELVHKATDRKIFAQGAVRAALWATNKESGYYSMSDVLDLS